MSRLDLELLPGLALLTTYATLISPKAQKTTPGPPGLAGRRATPTRPSQAKPDTRLLRGDRVIPSTPAQLSPRPADPGPLSTRDLRPSRTFKMGLQPVLWIPFSGKLRVSPLLLGREPQGSIPALWADRAPLPSVPPHAPRAARESSSTPLRPGGPLEFPGGSLTELVRWRAPHSSPCLTFSLGIWALGPVGPFPAALTWAHLGTLRPLAQGDRSAPGTGTPNGGCCFRPSATGPSSIQQTPADGHSVPAQRCPPVLLRGATRKCPTSLGPPSWGWTPGVRSLPEILTTLTPHPRSHALASAFPPRLPPSLSSPPTPACLLRAY